MLDATLQVLVRDGKARLTTTRVAARAGVSVGTLYQYFPNKSSLLQAALRRHLEGVYSLVRGAMAGFAGQPLEEICAGVARAFLATKLHDPAVGVALYQVSADVEGARIAQDLGEKLRFALEELLLTAPDPVVDAALMSGMLFSTIAGISRRLVEQDDPTRCLPGFQRELEALVRGYAIQSRVQP